MLPTIKEKNKKDDLRIRNALLILLSILAISGWTTTIIMTYLYSNQRQAIEELTKAATERDFFHDRLITIESHPEIAKIMEKEIHEKESKDHHLLMTKSLKNTKD
jgi:hypothetical protein